MNISDQEAQRLAASAIKNMDVLMARTLILGNNVPLQNLGITNKEMFYFIRNVALLNETILLRVLLGHCNYRELGGKVLWTVLNNIEVAKTMVEAGAALDVGQNDATIDFTRTGWIRNMAPMGLMNQGPNHVAIEFMKQHQQNWAQTVPPLAHVNQRPSYAATEFMGQYQQNWAQTIPPHGYGSKQPTFLHVLISSNDPVKLELAEFMIRHNADVNAVDENGNSVLKCAIEAGVSNEFIEKLMHKNIRSYMILYDHPIYHSHIQNTHYFERDVVTIADCERTVDLIPLIVMTGAEDELVRRDRAGRAIFALINSHPTKIDVIEALFDQYDIPIDLLDYKGHTPLHNAVLIADTNLVEFFLKRNADPNRSTFGGEQPLWIASSMDELVISSLLIKYGADVNRPNRINSQRPIQAACENCSMNNIFLLTHLGADMNVTNSHGLTPFLMLFDGLSLSNMNFGVSVHEAFILRQFALAAFRGVEFDGPYMRMIENYPRLHDLYVLDFHELQRMQRIEADNGIPYYTFMTGSIEKTSRLTRREDLTSVFENLTMLRDLFPCYFCDLRNTYILAKERENQVIIREKLLDEIITENFQMVLPHLAIKIISYLSEIEFFPLTLPNIIWE